jgi:NTP pyrophosphatase (non-canonical NTP hydrolase)
MDFITYTQTTKETAKYPREQSLFYLVLGLASEAGEVASVVKKWIRDVGLIDSQNIPQELSQKLASELGDVLWYFSEICRVCGLDPSKVLQDNYEKLADRLRRGVISGSGDDR